MKRYTKLIAVLSLSMMTFFTQAQNEKTVAAFKLSFEKETAKDYLGAIKALNSTEDSTSYECLLRQGWLYYKAGIKKKSMTYYQRAIQLKPKAIEPRYGFCFPAVQLEDYEALVSQDLKILEIDPNSKMINSNLGLTYYYNKQYQKSLPLFQKVVKHYPFDYDNNLNLAWNYLRLGNNEEAEKYFKVVLLYSPTDASAKEGMENIGKPLSSNSELEGVFLKSYELSEKSDNKGAAAILKSSYDKSNYFLNLRLGWLSYLSGSYLEAVQYYKTASELKPEAIEPLLGLAIPTEAMGNKNDLKTIYETILKKDPMNTSVHYKLGNLYYGKQEYDSAYVHFEKVVDLYPFDYDGLLMYAWANYQVGKNPEARILFYKVLCLSPGDQSAMRGLTLKPVEIQRELDHKPIIKQKN